MRLVLVTLLVILSEYSAGAARIYPRMARASNESCTDEADCTRAAPFCLGGAFCRQGRCWRLPDWPCPSTDWCDERLRACVERKCQSWRDCDDEIFCNGIELCVAGRCILRPGSDCSADGDICDESARRCSRVKGVEAVRAQLLAGSTAGGDVRAQDTPTVAPTSAPTNSTIPVGSITNAQLAWIIIGIGLGVIVVGGLALVLSASKRQQPTALIDYRGGGAGQVYLPEVQY
jgi:hypothetical protein